MKSLSLFVGFALLLTSHAHAADTVCKRFIDQELKAYRANHGNIAIADPFVGPVAMNFYAQEAEVDKKISSYDPADSRAKKLDKEKMAIEAKEKQLSPEVADALTNTFHADKDLPVVAPIFYKDRNGKYALVVYKAVNGDSAIISYADSGVAKVFLLGRDCHLNVGQNSTPIHFYTTADSQEQTAYNLADYRTCQEKPKLLALMAHMPTDEILRDKELCEAHGGIVLPPYENPKTHCYCDPGKSIRLSSLTALNNFHVGMDIDRSDCRSYYPNRPVKLSAEQKVESLLYGNGEYARALYPFAHAANSVLWKTCSGYADEYKLAAERQGTFRGEAASRMKTSRDVYSSRHGKRDSASGKTSTEAAASTESSKPAN